MKLSEKLSVLSELGILDWLNEGDSDDNLRVLVNSIAGYFFEDQSVFDFAPSCDFDAIHEYFTQTGFDIDWYEMITYNFSKSVDEDCRDHIYCINCDNYIMPEQELETWISDWVNEWCTICNKVFTDAMKTD